MAHSYQVRVKDTSGALVTVLTEWMRLNYTNRLNGASTLRLEIDGQLDLADLFTLDSQVEIWRANTDAGISLYRDFEGFHRSPERMTDNNGVARFISHCVGYTDLLARRIILYPAGSSGASKSGPGETVLKEYVDENAGPGATSPPRLLASGVTTGLSIQADGGAGSTWTGARAYRNLLEVCQEIAPESGVDFGVVGTGPATFELRAKALPWGDDRSTQGLNPATGLNGAGNPPSIFTLGRGNMGSPRYSIAHQSEVNAVLVLGQGVEADRVVVERTRSGAIAASPWNRREISRQGNAESTLGGLQVIGDRLLAELEARETFSFEIIETEGFRYGRDWFMGDLVTARYRDIERHKQIVGVSVQVQQGEERINVELGDRA